MDFLWMKGWLSGWEAELAQLTCASRALMTRGSNEKAMERRPESEANLAPRGPYRHIPLVKAFGESGQKSERYCGHKSWGTETKHMKTQNLP